MVGIRSRILLEMWILEGAALVERARCLNFFMMFQKVAEGVNGLRSEQNFINDSRLFFLKIFWRLVRRI